MFYLTRFYYPCQVDGVRFYFDVVVNIESAVVRR